MSTAPSQCSSLAGQPHSCAVLRIILGLPLNPRQDMRWNARARQRTLLGSAAAALAAAIVSPYRRHGGMDHRILRLKTFLSGFGTSINEQKQRNTLPSRRHRDLDLRAAGLDGPRAQRAEHPAGAGRPTRSESAADETRSTAAATAAAASAGSGAAGPRRATAASAAAPGRPGAQAAAGERARADAAARAGATARAERATSAASPAERACATAGADGPRAAATATA